jgi:hypothetical protein
VSAFHHILEFVSMGQRIVTRYCALNGEIDTTSFVGEPPSPWLLPTTSEEVPRFGPQLADYLRYTQMLL